MCKQTEKPVPYYLFIFRQVMVAFVFFRIIVSVISLEQKINKMRQAFHLLPDA